MKKLTLLQLAVFVLLAPALLVAAAPPADPCAAIKAELSKLGTRYSDLSDQYERTRDEHRKNVLRNQMAALLPQLNAKKKEVERCIAETPPPAPLPGSFVVGGGNDFQVAVGHQNIVTVTSSEIHFFTKTATPVEIRNWSAGELFKDLWTGSNDDKIRGNINFHLNLPSSATFKCDPTSPKLPNRFLNRSTEDRQKHLNELNSCINEYYDTRVLYDNQRHRFWIESAARNHIWTCTHDDLGFSGFRTDPEFDPDSTQDTGSFCHAEWKGPALRYIAIAVSKTENPNDGFYFYTLVSDYSDWPLMALHDNALVLTHQKDQLIWIYDADDLANGRFHFKRIDQPTFGAPNFVVPSQRIFPTRVYPAIIHGNTGGHLVFTGLTEQGLAVYSFAAAKTQIQQPQIKYLGLIKLDYPPDGLTNNPVYRDGELYVTFNRCVKDLNEKQNCTVNVVRAKIDILGSSVTKDLETSFGRLSGETSAELPVAEVDSHGNIAVVYGTFNLMGARAGTTDTLFRVLYHDESSFRPARMIRKGIGTTSKGPVTSHVDLAGASIDPSDESIIWFSHAFSDPSNAFTQVIAAVQPD